MKIEEEDLGYFSRAAKLKNELALGGTRFTNTDSGKLISMNTASDNTFGFQNQRHYILREGTN